MTRESRYERALRLLRDADLHEDVTKLINWTNKGGGKSGWDRIVLMPEWSHTWSVLGLVPHPVSVKKLEEAGRSLSRET